MTILLGSLGQNIALLLSFTLLYSLLSRLWQQLSANSQSLIIGMLFGVMAILGMLIPVQVAPGILVDGRVVVVGLASTLGGPITAVIAGGLVSAYRLWLGGVGALPGVGAILSAAVIGAWFRRRWRKGIGYGASEGISYYKLPILLLLGIVLAAEGLLWTFTLPADQAWATLRVLALPVTLLYPSGTLLLGTLLSYEQRQQETELALRRSEERLRTLVDHAPEAIVVLDADAGVFVDANENAVRLFGLSREALFKVGPVELSPLQQPNGRSSADYAADILQEALDGGTPRFEWVHRTIDGEEILCEIRLVRLPATGHNLVRGSMIDIRERRRLETQLRQAQKLEAIGLLAGGIAHDFNNLLTSINGYAELLQRRLKSDNPLRKYADSILYSGQQATTLTSQLLAFSRRQVLTPRVLDLSIIVTNMEKMLKRIIGEDIQMETAVVPDLWPVKADPAQIEQIIMNLAVNARDAMPDGGHLTIELDNVHVDEQFATKHLRTGSGEYVVLTVRDTGYGMSHEVKDHIFEPFFTTKNMSRGTGLGLSTVFGIVKQSGGNILVFSEENIGTTFKIYLPRTTELLQMHPQQRDDIELPAGNETILLVEDDAHVRQLLAQVLQAQGYTLLVAEDSQEAVRCFKQYSGHIDMLLTDIIMPGLGGEALSQQLVQHQPELRTLYMSGYTGHTITQLGELKPGIAFLQKPFGPLALTRKVREVLDRKATGPCVTA